MINEEQINAFVHQVEQKGYTLDFANSEDVTGSLSTLLGLSMLRHASLIDEGKPFTETYKTVTDAAPRFSRITTCELSIEYQREKGFNVNLLTIERLESKKRQYEPFKGVKKTRHIDVKSMELLPTKDFANQIGLQLDDYKVRVDLRHHRKQNLN